MIEKYKLHEVARDLNINGKDLILLRQKLAGWDVTVSPDSADANADGSVDGKDLILLRQKLAGWNVVLGPKPEHSLVGEWAWGQRTDEDMSEYGESGILASFDVDIMGFNEDGTSYSYYLGWVSWDLVNGGPGDHWDVAPMGYDFFTITYTLEGDQLTVNYAPSDYTDGGTVVYTVSWSDDGSLLINNAPYLLLPRSASEMTPEELLIFFGLDPNVPEN